LSKFITNQTELLKDLLNIYIPASNRLDWQAGSIPRSLRRKFTTSEKAVTQFSDWGMDPASTIGPKVRNFLSNEDTQELAPGFFIFWSDISIFPAF
jgi:hypothetical protein